MTVAQMDQSAGRGSTPRQSGQPRRVRDVLSDYIEERERSRLAPIAIRTARDYRSVLSNHVCRPTANIGTVLAATLTPRDIRNWMEDLAQDGVGANTIANARRVLGAALAWEVREGSLAANPMVHVRIESSKARRAALQAADTVLLPSWAEFATLVAHPDRERDRLLIALLGWTGLRWGEAVSLDEQAVWRDRPLITVERVLVRRTHKEVEAGLTTAGDQDPYWRQEPPKAGLTATVPLPKPLWRRLVALAEYRRLEGPLPEPAGHLLFQRPRIPLDGTYGLGVLDNSNFRRDVWVRARQAAGLNGDPQLPRLDPRRLPLKIKDLRAFAASVLLDSGSSLTEAAVLLRHGDLRTTERHYARAMHERAHDRARRETTIDKAAPLGDRLDALWEAWTAGFPTLAPSLGLDPSIIEFARTTRDLR